MREKQLFELSAPQETCTCSSVALLWNKIERAVNYRIYVGEQQIDECLETDYTLEELECDREYMICVSALLNDGQEVKSNSVHICTKKKPACIDITEYGAVGDGIFLNTQIIQQTIDDCEVDGVVYIPKGIFLTGALYLKSNMTLHIVEGGKLLGSDDLSDFPVMQYRFEGIETDCYSSLLNTANNGQEPLRNIIISGKGTIDANGSCLRQQALKENRGKPGRAICFRNVEGIYIKDVTIRQSPTWCVHFIYSKNISINGARIFTKFDEMGRRYEGISNGDGVDPDSCSHVRIFNTLIASQDDCIAIKSGRNEEGRRVGIASEYIRITNCRFKSGFGVAIGSEMAGSVRNVLIQDCVFENVYSAVSIKAPRGRGGVIENVICDNLVHYYHEDEERDCKWYRGALYIDQFYSHEVFNPNEAEPIDDGTPIIQNILFKNIEVDTIGGNAIYMSGLAESPLKNIRLNSVKAIGITGMKASNIQGLELKDVDVVSRSRLTDDVGQNND